jgi:hypothetical protein
MASAETGAGGAKYAMMVPTGTIVISSKTS